MLEPGRRWNGSKMEWKTTWREEDERRKENGETRIMREVQKMANSLEPDIQLTVDTPSELADGKLPVLDLKMWMEERVGEGGVRYQEVVHEFYEKDMVAARVIGKESAMQLMLSGYKEEERKDILVAWLKGFKRLEEA